MSENDTTLEDRFGPMPESSIPSFKDESAFQNELTFRRQYDAIMAQYQKGWVAILDGKVIDHAQDVEDLHKRLHVSHPCQPVYLRELTDPKAYKEPKRIGSPLLRR